MSDTKSKIQKSILDAAQTRFVKYGFKKTNMIEIAQDSQMSPGNLYRFFNSKEEMGTAVVTRLFTCKYLKTSKVLSPASSAVVNLTLFCSSLLKFYYELCHRQEHLTELIDFVLAKNKDVLDELINHKKDTIQLILEAGHASCEFQVENAGSESSTLVNLLNSFLLPNWGLYQESSLAELEKELSDSIQLIYRGLQGNGSGS